MGADCRLVFLAAGCFGRRLQLWFRTGLIIALPAFPICQVVAFGAGSTFVAPKLVASEVKGVRSIPPFPCKEMFGSILNIALCGFLRFGFQDF